jgi:tetratricopeptide (TPR) repeat protein
VKFLIIVVSMVFFSTAFCAGENLDWKRLNEEADQKSLQEAIRNADDQSDSLDALCVLGLVYLNQHKDSDAENIFALMLRKNPDSSEATWGVAEVMRRKHNADESQRLLEKVIKACPDFSPAYISLSYIKYSQTAFKESADLASFVMHQGKDKVDRSNYTRAYLLVAGARGMIAYNGGPIVKIRYGGSVLGYLRKAEELQPHSAAVLFGLGSYYFLAPSLLGGNRQKALDYFEAAIRSDPLFTDAYVRLAQLYRMKGDEIKYQAYLEKAKQIDPQNFLLLDMQNKKCKFICVSTER